MRRVLLAIIVMESFALAGVPDGVADELHGRVTNLPFAMTAPEAPAIPDRIVSITEHGALGDGQTMNTAAFAAAIEACAKAGGGRVVVPRGVWLTGPIKLASRIDLHLEQGALVLFSQRVEDYAATDGDSGRRTVVSPIQGVGLEDIAITGQGIIDGSGDAWRPVKKEKMTAGQWSGLLASGGTVNAAGDIWYPSKEAMTPGSLPSMRPRMVQLTECKRVLLDGPTFQNSPAWNIHPLLCEDVIIRNVTVLNPWYSQNGDGLDLDACRRVAVYRSRFDVGDDAICLKSGAGPAARQRGRACEDIAIWDCTVYHGHGGVTIGSEMSGGVRNVYIDNCVFLGTDLGLRFKSTRGRGGIVENLFYNNVYMKAIPTDAIGFTMSYGGRAPTETPADEGQEAVPIPAVNEGTPQFRSIHFKNIVCNGAKRAVHLEGLPEMPIEGIELANITISAKTGFECLYAKDVRVANAKILPETGSVFRVTDSTDVTIEKAACPQGAKTFLTISGAKTGGIRLLDTDTSRAAKPIEFARGATPDAVAGH
jgi:polygalacturonase